MTLVHKAWSFHRGLTLATLLSVALILPPLVGMVLDPKVIGGVNAWIKPLKFAIASAIYAASFLWLLTFARRRRRLARALGHVTAGVLILEVILILMQVVRGTTSHFNTATPFDAAVFSVMGTAITVLASMSLALAIVLAREPMPDRALGAGIRLGVLSSFFGMMVAFLMTSPTPEQLEAMRAGAEVTAIGSHTVGFPDGGPGLPFFGWSLEGGDLRVPHFVGIHGVQALAILGWMLALPTARRRWREAQRASLVRIGAAAYIGWIGLLTWQALRGQSVASLDGQTATAYAVLIGGASLAAWLVATKRGETKGSTQGGLRTDAAQRRFIAALIPLFGLGVLTTALNACNSTESHAATEPSPLPVETMLAQELDHYEVRRVFSGTVRSRRASQLGFELPGLVDKVYVDEGDAVKEGQLIAEVDTAQLRAARRRVLASLKEAQAGVGISTLTADRLEKLAQDQYISKQSADEARFSLQAAEAKRMELRAALAQIDVDLEKSRLVAPFSGIVSTRLVDEGTVVAAGAPVVRFRESDEREALIGLPRSIPIETGSTQELILDGRSVEAQVAALVNDVDARTRTVTAILELPKDIEAADGQVIDLVHRRRVVDSGFWVPTTALTEGLRGTWTVYSVKADGDAGIVRREAVEVLHAETDRAFVRGTLEPSDQIIATGLHRVVPGQRVIVSARHAEAVEEPSL